MVIHQNDKWEYTGNNDIANKLMAGICREYINAKIMGQ